ncbi:hypothetical protein ACFL52_01180 [Candidatus Margulisiibacteriota bacterium]
MFAQVDSRIGFVFDIGHFMIMCFNYAQIPVQERFIKGDESKRQAILLELFKERLEEVDGAVLGRLTEIHTSHPVFTTDHVALEENPFKLGMLRDDHQASGELEYRILEYLLKEKKLRPQYITIEDFSDADTLLAQATNMRKFLDSLG